MSWSSSPMFSSSSFVVWGLILKSVFQFELIFINGERRCLVSFFWMWIYNFSNLLKILCSLQFMFLATSCKISCCRCIGLTSRFSIQYIRLWVYFYVSAMLSWLLQLCEMFSSQVTYGSCFVLLAQEDFGYSGIFIAPS
jgi:hypothetical protein